MLFSTVVVRLLPVPTEMSPAPFTAATVIVAESASVRSPVRFTVAVAAKAACAPLRIRVPLSMSIVPVAPMSRVTVIAPSVANRTLPAPVTSFFASVTAPSYTSQALSATVTRLVDKASFAATCSSPPFTSVSPM